MVKLNAVPHKVPFDKRLCSYQVYIPLIPGVGPRRCHQAKCTPDKTVCAWNLTFYLLEQHDFWPWGISLQLSPNMHHFLSAGSFRKTSGLVSLSASICQANSTLYCQLSVGVFGGDKETWLIEVDWPLKNIVLNCMDPFIQGVFSVINTTVNTTHSEVDWICGCVSSDTEELGILRVNCKLYADFSTTGRVRAPNYPPPPRLFKGQLYLPVSSSIVDL